MCITIRMVLVIGLSSSGYSRLSREHLYTHPYDPVDIKFHRCFLILKIHCVLKIISKPNCVPATSVTSLCM